MGRFDWRFGVATAVLGAAALPCPAGDGSQNSTRSVVLTSAGKLGAVGGTTETRGVAAVTAVAIDPRHRFLAVAEDTDRIHLLDATTLREVAQLDRHTDRVRDLAFDGDGSRLASVGNDGRLVLWNIDHGDRDRGRVRVRPVRSMSGGAALTRCRFSPDGDRLAVAGFGGDLIVVDASDGLVGGSGASGRSAIRRHRCGGDLRAIAFADDGRIAVAGRRGVVHVFDGPRRVKQIRCGGGPVNDLRFCDADSIVAIGDDGVVRRLNVESGRTTASVAIRHGRLYCVAAATPDRVAVGGSDDSIHWVDLDSQTVVETLTGHEGTVVSLRIDGDHLISAGFDATVRRWPIETEERIADNDSATERR